MSGSTRVVEFEPRVFEFVWIRLVSDSIREKMSGNLRKTIETCVPLVRNLNGLNMDRYLSSDNDESNFNVFAKFAGVNPIAVLAVLFYLGHFAFQQRLLTRWVSRGPPVTQAILSSQAVLIILCRTNHYHEMFRNINKIRHNYNEQLSSMAHTAWWYDSDL